ncbi:MAG: hypothetical protein AAGI24_07870 [Pseudomonadota bacterium]
MPMLFRSTYVLVLSLLLLPALASAQDDDPGFAARLTQKFLDSDIDFQRARSNVPFLPLATLTARHYGNTEVELSSGFELEYDLSTISQYAVLPILISQRDALFVGEYLSYSDFKVDAPGVEDFDVGTVGLPVGWLHQATPDWQLGGFVMPLAHRSSLEGSDWNMQYMGGAFGRYIQADNLWWLYGIYADYSPDDDFVIPYVGASWSINERWTLSAVLPWPAILYSPDGNWVYRFGLSPSGASWNISTSDGDVGVNYDAWDLGFTVERRIAGNIFLGARAGTGGLRGVRFDGSGFDAPDFDVGSSAFFGIDLSFRPGFGGEGPPVPGMPGGGF